MKKMILMASLLVGSLHAMDNQAKLSDVYKNLFSGVLQTNSKSLELIPEDQLIPDTLRIEDKIFTFGGQRKAEQNEVSFYRTTTRGQKIITEYIPVSDGKNLVHQDKIEQGRFPKCNISALIHFGLRSEICYVNKSKAIDRLSSHAFAVNFLQMCYDKDVIKLKAMISYLTPQEAVSFLDNAQDFLPETNTILKTSGMLDKVVCGGQEVDLKDVRKEKQEAAQIKENKANKIKTWKNIRRTIRNFVWSWKGFALGGLTVAIATYWLLIKGQ